MSYLQFLNKDLIGELSLFISEIISYYKERNVYKFVYSLSSLFDSNVKKYIKKMMYPSNGRYDFKTFPSLKVYTSLEYLTLYTYDVEIYARIDICKLHETFPKIKCVRIEFYYQIKDNLISIINEIPPYKLQIICDRYAVQKFVEYNITHIKLNDLLFLRLLTDKFYMDMTIYSDISVLYKSNVKEIITTNSSVIERHFTNQEYTTIYVCADTHQDAYNIIRKVNLKVTSIIYSLKHVPLSPFIVKHYHKNIVGERILLWLDADMLNHKFIFDLYRDVQRPLDMVYFDDIEYYKILSIPLPRDCTLKKFELTYSYI